MSADKPTPTEPGAYYDANGGVWDVWRTATSWYATCADDFEAPVGSIRWATDEHGAIVRVPTLGEVEAVERLKAYNAELKNDLVAGRWVRQLVEARDAAIRLAAEGHSRSKADGLTDLAREVVTLPGWRWMAGMVAVSPSGARFRLVEEPGGLWWRRISQPVRDPGTDAGPDLPDLSDPATVGCIHDLVEEACGGPVSVVHDPDDVRPEWRWEAVSEAHARGFAHGPIRAEALVALWREVTRG